MAKIQPYYEKPIIEEQPKEETISLNTYLSNFSGHRRNLDKVIVAWVRKKDSSNPNKTKTEWDKLLEEFFSETEK